MVAGLVIVKGHWFLFLVQMMSPASKWLPAAFPDRTIIRAAPAFVVHANNGRDLLG